MFKNSKKNLFDTDKLNRTPWSKDPKKRYNQCRHYLNNNHKYYDENGTYYVKERVRVEHLVNAKVGFKVLGEVDMIHDNDGYHFEGTLNDGTPFTFTKTPQTTRSVHIEYDFKERGDALDIVYNDETYFVFPLTNASSLTKYNFSTEAIYFKKFLD